MLKDIFNRVTFIHGWLFGNYIWTNVIDYFDSINNKNFVTFNGYSDNSNEFDREEKVKLILNSTNKDDLIIAYSFGASSILTNKYLNNCKGSIILINPFFSEKKDSIKELHNSINTDFHEGVKKFMFNCVKGSSNTKKNYSELHKLFYHNYTPSVDLLSSELDEMMQVELSNHSIDKKLDIHILQSKNDEVNSMQYISHLEKQKISVVKVDSCPHYPFFEFNKIYDIINNIYGNS